MNTENEAPKGAGRIGRDDWIRAALALLLDEGIAGVRVEPLALRLGVTKGSFYWHFKDRAALHAAMLAQWRASTTRDVIARFEREGGAPRAKLRRVLALATGGGATAVALDTAMRGWGRLEPSVAAAIAATDDERIAYMAGLLHAMGLPPGPADLRARILYLAWVGSSFSQAARRGLWRELEALISRT
ncbi:TetR/AcrR family transcriptional regulator [Zavarzinia compransoris]|nr:TetR/AcrR family transcriptional regulator [Zavarzinia compransoris]TDP44294.1 TetR family transcriptional regulator [Zavarzinia compransoris]